MLTVFTLSLCRNLPFLQNIFKFIFTQLSSVKKGLLQLFFGLGNSTLHCRKYFKNPAQKHNKSNKTKTTRIFLRTNLPGSAHDLDSSTYPPIGRVFFLLFIAPYTDHLTNQHACFKTAPVYALQKKKGVEHWM